MYIDPFPRTFRTCPIEALPDLFYNAACYIRTLEGDVPAEALLTDAIAASSAAVHLCNNVRGLDHRVMPTSMNTLAVIPSGVGKGTSFGLLFQAFEAMEEEKLIQAVKAGAKTSRDGLILQEATYRALIEHLAGINRSASIQHEDGWSFLHSDLISRYIDKLTQLWSGNPPLKHRVHKVDLTAVGGRCSLGFRIQPDVIYPFLKRTNNASFHQGLWARAIAACYDLKRIRTPKTFMAARSPGSGLKEFSARITELLTEADDREKAGQTERKLVELDKDAAAFMHELKYRMALWRDTEYADIHEAACRAWENTLRLAAVFQVVCVGDDAITLDMVERAWTIVEWSLSQHRLIFVRANQSDQKQIIATATKLANPKPQKRPRPIEDAHWVLECLVDICNQRYMDQAMLSDVERLAGLHGKRLETAIEWLKFEQLVETHRAGAHTVIRMIQVSGGSKRRVSTGRL